LLAPASLTLPPFPSVLGAPPAPPGAPLAPLVPAVVVSPGSSSSRESIEHAPTPTSAAHPAALVQPRERHLQHPTIGGESIAARATLHPLSSLGPWLR